MTSGLSRTPTWAWALIALIAILWHLLLLYGAKPLWTLPPSEHRIAVEQIDSSRLDEIRKRWSDPRNRAKPIVLPKGETPSAEAPKNARYMSDRNIRVEKEQRARPGNEGSALENPAPAAPPRAAPKRSVDRPRFPAIGNLGVPLDLNRPAPPSPSDSSEKVADRRRLALPKDSTLRGDSDQQIMDKNLPEGSQTLLNAEESVYYSFFARMRDQLQPNWVRELRERLGARPSQMRPGEYYTLIQIVLDPDGKIETDEIDQSSGVD